MHHPQPDPYLQFLQSVQQNPEIALHGFVFCSFSDPDQLPVLLEGAHEVFQAEHLPDATVEDLFSQHPVFSGQQNPVTWVLPHDPTQVEMFFFHLHFLLSRNLQEDHSPRKKRLLWGLVFIPRSAIPALMNQNFQIVTSPYGVHLFDDDLKGVLNLEDLLRVGRMTVMDRPWLDQKRLSFMLEHFSQVPTDATPFQWMRALYALNHPQNSLPAVERAPVMVDVLTFLLRSRQNTIAFRVGSMFVRWDLLKWREWVPAEVLLPLVFRLLDAGLSQKLRYSILHNLSPLMDRCTDLDWVRDFQFDLKVLQRNCQEFLQDRAQLPEGPDREDELSALLDQARPASCLVHMLSLTPVKNWPSLLAEFRPLLDLLMEDFTHLVGQEEEPSQLTRSLVRVLGCWFAVMPEQHMPTHWKDVLIQRTLQDEGLQQEFQQLCLYFDQAVPEELRQLPVWEKVREENPKRNPHVLEILNLLLCGQTTREEHQQMKQHLDIHVEQKIARQLERAQKKHQKTPESWRVIGDYGRMFYGEQDVFTLLSILDVLLGNPSLALWHMKTAMELQISFTSKHFNYKYNFAQQIQTLHLARHHLFVLEWAETQGVPVHPLEKAWTHKVIEETAWVEGHLSAVDVFPGGFVHLHSLLSLVCTRLLKA